MSAPGGAAAAAPRGATPDVTTVKSKVATTEIAAARSLIIRLMCVCIGWIGENLRTI
jgi:hypothetical protein